MCDPPDGWSFIYARVRERERERERERRRQEGVRDAFPVPRIPDN